MIDVHCHVLYGIDDGAKTIEDSLAILKKMYQLGYTKIILTPHYIENTKYVANNKKKNELLKEIKLKMQEEQIPIELYLGNEVYIDDTIINKINAGEISTLNSKDYLLIELPMFEKMPNDLDILFKLISKGIHVVLAHPERYLLFQKNPKLLDEYTKIGVLLQGNFESLTGKYGTKAKKLFLALLKKRKYFVLGSDIHHADSSFFNVMPKVSKEIIKLTDINYFNELVEINPQKIIDNVILEEDD
jgi:protein-tyrosine phosphatase